MPDLDINDVASVGLIGDIAPYQLPPEAWSTLLNVRLTRDGVQRLLGWEQVLGTLTGDPHFILPVRTPAGELWWIYADLTAAYALDGSTETNITRAVGGAYTAANGYEWNGTWLGGIPVLNNGNDVPQYWTTISLASDLANMTNWPAALRAKVLRAFGPNLVALNLTESGTRYAHAVQWSHPADPGSLPSSWDITDETVDAGRVDLADTESGVLLDGLPLRTSMVLYKEASTWLMRRIGGPFVFQFDQFLVTSGLLAPRCAAQTGDGKYHFVVTQDDVILHDSTAAKSIIDKKMRTTLFNRIDADNVNACFVFANPLRREMWFCYPDSGNTTPTLALIWSYGAGGGEGVFYEAEISFRCGATGDIATAAADTWDADSDTWDSDVTAWSSSDRRRCVVGDVAAGKIFQLDTGLTRDGSAFTATAQREGLAFLGRRRSGEPIVDFTAWKFIRRVWPKVEGGSVNVRVGFQELVDGSITWSTAQAFDPTTQLYLDFEGSGRAVAVEFASTASNDWKLNGYKLEVVKRSRF